MIKGCGGIREAEVVPSDVTLVHYKVADVLVSNIRPYLKKVWLADRDGGCSSDVIVFRSNRKDLSPEYLYRVLSQEGFFDYSMQNVSGTKMPRGKRDWIKKFEFPLPPLPVQREIVARLEKELGEADALAAKFKEIAENADAEFKAELYETFNRLQGDVSRKGTEAQKIRLGDVFKFIDYRGMTPVKTESGVSLITAKNVRQGFLDYKEETFISNEDYKKRQTRGIAHKGDILFTTEAPLGFVALADRDVFSTGQRIITFQQKDEDSQWCNKYFLYCLMSDWFQKQLWRQATGATAKGIKSSRLIELPVIVISSQDQKAIAESLDKTKARCEKLKAAAERGLRAAEDLRKAILAEAFR